jgi:hypothetical protein
MKKILLSTCIALSSFLSLTAQPDDLAKMMEEEMSKDVEPDYATATFKTTRLINGHTIENVAAGVLDMRISHRFGAINSGIQQFYGLDVATMRVSLEYGINRWLMIGGGRSTYEKTYDSFLKAKLLRQSKGTRNMPITLSYMASMQTITIPYANPDRTNFFTSNMFFVHQLIIARKFNDSFSFQISPTLVHRNLVDSIATPHDLFSIGMGGRMKLTRRTSINVEYFYQLSRFKPAGTTDMLSIGFDIETGGHVFQLCFTNSPYMIEKAFIHQNTGSWKAGDIIGGFNISRNFTIRDPRQSKKAKKSEG